MVLAAGASSAHRNKKPKSESAKLVGLRDERSGDVGGKSFACCSGDAMSSEKKLVRERFRNAVFHRDNSRCRGCGWALIRPGEVELDAHHITDRNLMPNGGYVKENGISLCPPCHQKAEVFHSTGTALPGWSPEDLYKMIGSSHEQAIKASERLK